MILVREPLTDRLMPACARARQEPRILLSSMPIEGEYTSTRSSGLRNKSLARVPSGPGFVLSAVVPAAVPPQITAPATNVKSRERYSITSAKDHTHVARIEMLAHLAIDPRLDSTLWGVSSPTTIHGPIERERSKFLPGCN